MKRRELLASLAVSPWALKGGGHTEAIRNSRGSFALDDNRVRFFNKAIPERFSILFIADTHLFRDDSRGEPYRTYSSRMAKAYNQTKHFQTGEPTNPEAYRL